MSPRLRSDARRMFDQEATTAEARARALRRRLHDRGDSITPETVTMRTYRLRQAVRIPKGSRPRKYGIERASHA